VADSNIVSAVHPDVVVTLQQFPLQEQTDAPWYLDRLDQDALPLDKKYHYTLDGSGTNVYVFDTVRGNPRNWPLLPVYNMPSYGLCWAVNGVAQHDCVLVLRQGIRTDHVEFKYKYGMNGKRFCRVLPWYTHQGPVRELFSMTMQARGHCTAFLRSKTTTRKTAMAMGHMSQPLSGD
jgi:hypothetical protein